MPDLTEQVGIPVKKVKPVTKPEPFNLEGETNGAVRAERWAEEVSTTRLNATYFMLKKVEKLKTEVWIWQ